MGILPLSSSEFVYRRCTQTQWTLHSSAFSQLVSLTTGRRPPSRGETSLARLSVAYKLCTDSEGGRPDHQVAFSIEYDVVLNV